MERVCFWLVLLCCAPALWAGPDDSYRLYWHRQAQEAAGGQPLVGQVNDLDGQPVAGAFVTLACHTTSRFGMSIYPPEQTQTVTAADGRWQTSERLSRWNWTALAFCPGYRYVDGGEVTAGRSTVIRMACQPGRVAGRVVDSRGRPQSRATVFAAGATRGGLMRMDAAQGDTPEWRERPVLTGDDGRFVLTGLPLGQIRITATCGYRQWGRVEAAAARSITEEYEVTVREPEPLPPARARRGAAGPSLGLAASGAGRP